MKELKQRIKKEAQIIKIETTLGTAVRVSKKEAYRFLNTLSTRKVEPKASFTEICNGRMLVIIGASAKTSHLA